MIDSNYLICLIIPRYILTLSARGPTLDVRIWRLKSIPALEEYYNCFT